MNKKMKQHLQAVVESVIFEDADTAKTEFHNYLNLKTQAILLGEKEDPEEDEKDDEKEGKKKSDDSDDSDDEGDEGDEDEGAKKKFPFAKKGGKVSKDEE